LLPRIYPFHLNLSIWSLLYLEDFDDGQWLESMEVIATMPHVWDVRLNPLYEEECYAPPCTLECCSLLEWQSLELSNHEEVKLALSALRGHYYTTCLAEQATESQAGVVYPYMACLFVARLALEGRMVWEDGILVLADDDDSSDDEQADDEQA